MGAIYGAFGADSRGSEIEQWCPNCDAKTVHTMVRIGRGQRARFTCKRCGRESWGGAGFGVLPRW